MLLKVTALVETVVWTGEKDLPRAIAEAMTIVRSRCFESLREDLGNAIDDESIPLAVQKIESEKDLPSGWDRECMAWGNETITCGKALANDK